MANENVGKNQRKSELLEIRESQKMLSGVEF